MIESKTEKDELLTWYQIECVENAVLINPVANRFFNIIRNYLYLFCGLLGLGIALSLISLILSMLTGDFPDIKISTISPTTLLFLYNFLSSIGMGVFVYVMANRNLESLDIMIADNSISILDENKATLFRSDVFDLCERMKIDRNKIRFWKAVSTNPFPSVEEDSEGTIHLIIPINFFVYYHKKRKEAVAVLAHELGHVLQSDTHLYATTVAYFSVIQFLFIPILCLNIISLIILLAQMFSGELASTVFSRIYTTCMLLYYSVILIYLLDAGAKIEKVRLKSELLADMASMYYTGTTAIISVLREFSGNGKIDRRLHPENEKRIEHLNDLIDRYKLTYQK